MCAYKRRGFIRLGLLHRTFRLNILFSMKSIVISAAFILAKVASVIAHGGVTSWSVGSTTYQGWQPYLSAAGQDTAGRPYSSYNPILDAVDPTIHCNNDGSNGPIPESITIAAGSDITAHWTQWTHAQGPVTVYMASCGATNCNNVKSSGLQWFKIDEAGLLSGTVYDGSWGTGIVMDTLEWTATIPAALKPGAYLIRFELLALHQANTPQFYPECANLIVTGSGTAFPSSDYLKPIPGAWGANDPGVNIDIYLDSAKTQTTYPVPGPPVWSGSNTPPPTSAPVTTPPPSTTVPTTVVPPPTTTAAGTVAKYGQCGGIGYSGPTGCVSGTTCNHVNDYYYQCL
ncbi:Endo-beta-1,4-glucanase D [Abortiporus biennis]